MSRKKKEEVEVIETPIETNEDIVEETNEEKNIYIVKTKKGGPLNVRKESGGEILKTIENGTEIEVLEIIDGWCRLENGYVLEELVIKKETC